MVKVDDCRALFLGSDEGEEDRVASVGPSENYEAAQEYDRGWTTNAVRYTGEHPRHEYTTDNSMILGGWLAILKEAGVEFLLATVCGCRVLLNIFCYSAGRF